MATPVKNTDFPDNWIKKQAFKYAYNEKTRGFIGKKYVKERVLSAVPREFITLGHTREQIALRLNEMLANDLTQALIRDCDEKRIKAGELEASALRYSRDAAIDDKGLGDAVDQPVRSTNTFGGNTLDAGTTSIGAVIDGGGGASIGGFCLPPSTFGSGSAGDTVKNDISEKGKKPMRATAEDENEDMQDSSIGETNRKVRSGSPQLSVSDVDRAIADFVAAKLPTVRPGPDVNMGGPEDIFSRGGSTPQRYRGRSPASSVFISPPPPPQGDPDIPSLPFKLQHRVLVTLQEIIECACYDFTRKHYPNFLIRKGWDCPEAGELTHWTRGLIAEFRERPTAAVIEAGDFPLALKGIDELRHSAVHRVPVSGRDIQRLIQKTRVVLHLLDASKRMRDQVNQINGIIEKNIQIVLDKRRRKDEQLRQELEKLEAWKRILELREVRAIRQAEHEEVNIQRSFRDDVAQALEVLGADRSVTGSIGTGTGTALGGEGTSNANEEEDEAVQSEAEIELDIGSSMSRQEEEYFHESEGW